MLAVSVLTSDSYSPQVPHSRAIYLCVFLIELTGRQQQPQWRQQRNTETQGWKKKQTQMLRGGKRGNQMNDDE